ncbi:MAG: glycosyltransferase [Eubacteriales bacterium]
MDHLKKTAIVILTFNNIEYSKNCLESIRKYTEEGTYEIIVVDNNSTDGTKEWLGEQKDIKLQLNETNAGFPAGCNMGIGLASDDSDILLLNNDTVVTSRWLSNLQKCLYSEDTIGAVGAVCNHNENLQGADFTYDNLDQMAALADNNNVSDRNRWEEKIFLIGFCILIKREVLNKTGPLDERYSPGYVEDNDLSLRILTAGYRLMLCHDCFIHHYLGSGFRKDLSKFYPTLYANRNYFKSKWGFETYIFDDVKYASIRIINEPDRFKKMNVLELGCGIGVTLLKIKNIYPNAVLFGQEQNEKMAEISKNIASVSVRGMGDFPMDFAEESFDYILIGNNLEIAENPEWYLFEIKKYLKPGGFIIGTIQNIMHYKVIQSILDGSWLYSSQNIVNKANRNLYAKNDILQLFARCGYSNPYIFHWFSVPTGEEKALIEKLHDMGQETSEYLFATYLFSVKFQK